MNSGAAGWGLPQPGNSNQLQLDNQVTSASQWSHSVRYFSPGRKRTLATDQACHAPPAKRRLVAVDRDFYSLACPKKVKELRKISQRFGKLYDGRVHGRFATHVKNYATSRQRPLNQQEQNSLIPCLQEFKPAAHWNWLSLTTVTHALTSAGIFNQQQCTQQTLWSTQAVLLMSLLEVVRYKCSLKPEVSGIDAIGIANMIWAMTRMVVNDQTLILNCKETVVVLLPHVIALKASFVPQEISILLWCMVKLPETDQALSPQLKPV